MGRLCEYVCVLAESLYCDREYRSEQDDGQQQQEKTTFLTEPLCHLRIFLAAKVSNRRESSFTHLIIISEKRGEEKRNEKRCRENLTSFHKTNYLVKVRIIFPELSFRLHLFP